MPTYPCPYDGYRSYLALMPVGVSVWVDAGWLFPPSKGAWIGCTVTVCTHTHTNVPVCMHIFIRWSLLMGTTMPSQGHSSSLPCRQPPGHAEFKGFSPGLALVHSPHSLALHGFCNLVVQKKKKKQFSCIVIMKHWFGPGLHIWHRWWFSATPEGPSGLLTAAYPCIFMHVYPNTHKHAHACTVLTLIWVAAAFTAPFWQMQKFVKFEFCCAVTLNYSLLSQPEGLVDMSIYSISGNNRGIAS